MRLKGRESRGNSGKPIALALARIPLQVHNRLEARELCVWSIESARICRIPAHFFTSLEKFVTTVTD